MTSDDTSTLFEPDPDQPPVLQLRQGIVQAWDADSGENSVQIAGGVLVNLPSLTAESATLVAGDVVAILSAEDRAVVLGKVTTPGDPGTVPTWEVDITALQVDVVTAQTTATTAQTTADTAQTTATTAQTTADSAASAAAAAAAEAAAAQAAADALDTRLDTAEANVATAQADINTLTDTTLPALQTQVDAILPITETDISDDAITTPKIAANAITAGEIAAGAVTTDKLEAGAVTAEKIAAGTITAAEIEAGAITGASLAADAIDGKTITGSLFRTAATGQRMEIAPAASLTEFRIYTGDPDEVTPGVYSVNTSGTMIESPNLGGGAARIFMDPDTTGLGGPTSIGLTAGIVTCNGFEVVNTAAAQVVSNKDLSDGTNTFPATSAWTNLPLVNSWVSDGGRTAQYCRDMTGRVQLRGRIKGNGSNGTLTIATLPAGFRPSQAMEWTMRSTAGIIVCAIEVATTGVITAVGNSSTVSGTGANIDCISFPTN